MGKTFRFGDVSAAPGEIGRGFLGGVEMADGSRSSVPLLVANGAQDGPTLVVLAAVHGTEVCGTAIIHQLMRNLDLSKLRGRLATVPAANPLAMAQGKYTAWVDGQNLSATWVAASKEGGTTQRLAAAIWPLIESADCVIDIHGNPMPAMAFTLASKSAGEETFRLARSFGVTMIKQPAPALYSRGMREILADKGIPVFCAEFAGDIYYWDSIADIGERGLRNVMKTLGMLDGEPEAHPDLPVLDGDFEYFTRMQSNRGGLVRFTAPPGTRLAEGDVAMEVYSVLGELVEEIRMPCDGYCWSFATERGSVVCEGQRVGFVFRESAG